jgi:peroxiredoxin
MKRAILLLTTLVALVLTANAQGLKIGDTLENFSLADTSGKTQTLNELKGKNGALVVFLSAQCPVVRAYKDRINQIAADYQAKGINFIGINSNVSESLDWVKSNIVEFNYKFPILIDKGNVLADRLNAQSTPEVYFLDAGDKLVYHGAIDNDRSGNNITQNYLKAAFDASLSGKPIAKTSTAAFGCTIKRMGQ